MRFFGSLVLLAVFAAHAQAGKLPNANKLGAKIDFADQKILDPKSKATVLVFLSFDCPMSNGYVQLLSDLARESKDVRVLGFVDEAPEDLAKHLQEYKPGFPVRRDEKLLVAEAVDARVTPECFVLDGAGKLRYRGRIDNTYVERLKKHSQATRFDLKIALQEVLDGKPVSEPATVAFGCHLARDERRSAEDGPITYYHDVLPILQKHCQACHRPGEVGPFSLLTYKQAVNWADDIKTYTQKRLMPPWKPSAGLAFQSERKMSELEIATLASWVDGGTPAGHPKDAPAARQFPEGWQLGQPDLLLSPKEEYTLGPSGKDVFRCFVMPTDLPDDVYVTAVEIRPGNPRIVHHVLLVLDQSGAARKLEAKGQAKEKAEADPANLDRGPGYSMIMGVGFLPQGGLTGWAPGNQGSHFPEGAGMLLPRKTDVVMQIHYHRDGRLETDKTQVGLYLAKKPVEKKVAGGVIVGRSGDGIFGTFFSIPAGVPDFKLQGNSWAHKDFTLYSVMPHMHMIGKSIKVTMTPPGGSERLLIDIPQWDYNWQETYFLKEPLAIKAGTKFHLEAIYDNSPNNPLNPFDPPRRITFGEQTFNEMSFVFLLGTSPHAPALGKGRRLPMGPSAPTIAK